MDPQNIHRALVAFIVTSGFQKRDLLLLRNTGNQLPVPPATRWRCALKRIAAVMAKVIRLNHHPDRAGRVNIFRIFRLFDIFALQISPAST